MQKRGGKASVGADELKLWCKQDGTPNTGPASAGAPSLVRLTAATKAWSPRKGRLMTALAVVMWLGYLIVVSSSTAGAARYAAFALDANTGQVLHAESADASRYPASLTKMMTLYMVFERLERGALSLNSRIQISPTAAAAPPSKLGLEPGDSIAVLDAMKSLITRSANDISIAIAEHLAGDEAKFAELMTRRAHQLGLTATTFRNSNGLPDAGQVTTARDMTMLALRLYDHFPGYIQMFSIGSFRYAGRNHRNHNTLMRSFRGMEGMKTGYIRASGYNLVASVRRDGRHVIAAVFGGRSGSARNARMRVILNKALVRASRQRTRKPDTRQLVVATRNGSQDIAAARPVPKLAEPVRPVVAAKHDPADRWTATARMAAPTLRGASVTEFLAAHQPDATLGAARQAGMAAMPVFDTRPTGAVRQPSTLQAQAARLARLHAATRHAAPAHAVASRSSPLLAAPVRQEASSPASPTVEIQIGAFATQQDAEQSLAAARQHVPADLARAATATPTVTVRGRRFVRARFTGLDADVAARACTQLRRRQIDCLVASGG